MFQVQSRSKSSQQHNTFNHKLNNNFHIKQLKFIKQRERVEHQTYIYLIDHFRDYPCPSELKHLNGSLGEFQKEDLVYLL